MAASSRGSWNKESPRYTFSRLHCRDCNNLCKKKGEKGYALRSQNNARLVPFGESEFYKDGERKYVFCKECKKYAYDEEGTKLVHNIPPPDPNIVIPFTPEELGSQQL